jgi:GMP synthase-like glutamine amidotransferase
MGGELYAGRDGEKGTYSIMLTDEGREDRLFHGVGHSFISFQWHDDSFSIPPGGTRLAFTGTCHNQAFRVGRRAWGLQFHPEVSREIVAEWSSWTPETAARSGEYLAAFRSGRKSTFGLDVGWWRISPGLRGSFPPPVEPSQSRAEPYALPRDLTAATGT